MRHQDFVDLHREGTFLLPNAWDAGSARILEAAGFPAIATTSAGIAFSLARPDHDFGNQVDRDTMLRRVAGIASEVSVPVSADLEDGYGRRPETVAETIKAAIDAGAAGGNIEDFTGDRAHPLHEVTQAVERIQAAREARSRPSTARSATRPVRCRRTS